MPASSHPASSPSDPLVRLGEIARVVEGAHHVAPAPGASLVRLGGLATAADPAAEIHLALLPVDAGDVLDLLVGDVVPPEWDAAGVVVEGTVRELVGQGLSPGQRLGSARTAVLVARDGACASVLRRAGEEPVCSVTAPDEPGPIGRIADALRRSLGLPTEPPAEPVGRLTLHVWLHRVQTLAVAGEPVDAALVDALRPAAPGTWSALREQCAQGVWSEIGCRPDIAAWMDDGMFARWCLASFPEPLEVLVELADLLSPAVAEHVATRIAEVARSASPRHREGHDS